MKPKPTPKRYRLFRKGAYGTFYIEDSVTRRQTSLKTKDRGEAERLLQAHCESAEAPDRAFRIGSAYFSNVDPESATRTWADVIDAYAKMHPEGSPTRHRIQTAGKAKSTRHLLSLPLLRTRPEELLQALRNGGVSCNSYLRRFQNFALDLSWLPRPIIPKKRWPKILHKPKRAITEQEHQRIVERETNPERRAFYQLCWHLGGSSSDVASLRADNIDWTRRIICYNRKKNQELSGIRFGSQCEAILHSLPVDGLLFPNLASVRSSDRATEFRQRCQGLGISGITIHSYRYSWAERAKKAGMPERFAQAALGHRSKAVHRFYARNAIADIPCLEELPLTKPDTSRPMADLPFNAQN